MTLQEVMIELQAMGNENTKRIFIKHGAREPFFGVKVEDLKKIQKRVKKDYALSMQLYATGNSDAMYLAGLIADPMKMTRQDLQTWAEGAYWYMISEFTVAWTASESPEGLALALEWLDSPHEHIATTAWATLSSLVAIKPDSELDIALLSELLDRVGNHIHQAQNRVRHCMNNFVIAIGTHVAPLHPKAIEIAQKIGKVKVNMGETACKVPVATDYIAKVQAMNKVGQKRKTARC
jgi:3-methyladenine DNA glycosylase AlkD